MFQRQRMFLEGRMAVGHGRMARIAGLRRKTEISHPQIAQLREPQIYVTARLLHVAGMQRQQQEQCQACRSKQQVLQGSTHNNFQQVN